MKKSYFLCLMRRKFWASDHGKPCCRDHRPDRPHRHPSPDPFCYQKFINYAGRTHLIFTNIYVINISDCCEFCQLLCFSSLSQNPRFNPFYSATSTFPDLSQRLAQIGTQASTGGMDGRLRIPLFSLSSAYSTPPKFPTFLQTAYCICPKCDVKYYQ